MVDNEDVEAVSFHSDIHGHGYLIGSKGLDGKIRRNIWTDKKNAALVEIVRNSPYPTPWRPAHGTNREIWLDITRQMSQMTDIFDFPIQWEAAKEQLLKIIDRQKMRRSLGDFEAKTITEKYVDEMIKHMMAEDAEKSAKTTLYRERVENRELRKSGVDVPPIPKKRRRNSLKHLPTERLIELSSGNIRSQFTGDEEYREEISYLQEREKLRSNADIQIEKIRSEREKERDEMLIARDQVFLKFVRDQLATDHELKQSTQSLISQVSELLGV